MKINVLLLNIFIHNFRPSDSISLNCTSPSYSRFVIVASVFCSLTNFSTRQLCIFYLWWTEQTFLNIFCSNHFLKLRIFSTWHRWSCEMMLALHFHVKLWEKFPLATGEKSISLHIWSCIMLHISTIINTHAKQLNSSVLW